MASGDSASTIAAVVMEPEQADPNDGSVLIFLAHNMAELQQMARGIGLRVWSAIAAFHANALSS